jgi:clan AA aspartic protease
MPSESGRVTATGEAVVKLCLSSGETADCIVDTGFIGALVLPRSVTKYLGLPTLGREKFGTVGNKQISADVSLVKIQWLGKEQHIGLVISDGEDYLIGTELLNGTHLFVDYITGVVSISNPE